MTVASYLLYGGRLQLSYLSLRKETKRQTIPFPSICYSVKTFFFFKCFVIDSEPHKAAAVSCLVRVCVCVGLFTAFVCLFCVCVSEL